MFELVLIICLELEGGDVCHTEISPNAAEIEVCETAGDFMARKIAWEIKASGGVGRVGWSCRRRGVGV